MEEVTLITPEQIKFIYKDTYNLYLKYKNCFRDEEWIDLIRERREIYHKYPFYLCEVMLNELTKIIEVTYMDKSKNGDAQNDNENNSTKMQ